MACRPLAPIGLFLTARRGVAGAGGHRPRTPCTVAVAPHSATVSFFTCHALRRLRYSTYSLNISVLGTEKPSETSRESAHTRWSASDGFPSLSRAEGQA